MRNTLVLLFTIYSCVLFAQNFSELSFGTDATFEIMTWNIEDFPKNGQTTINQVEAILKAVDVDFVCFQEIDDSTDLKDIVDNIDGYEVYIENGFWSGLAFMYNSSKVTIEEVYHIYDEFAYWSIFPRAPLVIEMVVDDENIVVINNHFKCCGDGNIDTGNEDDEEVKRLESVTLLKQYIDDSLSNDKVILIGDLNDELTDVVSKNVFQQFLDDNDNYRFADMAIANGSSADWSYPLWPSHLDHILVTDELFEFIERGDAEVEVIKIDDYLEAGLDDYDDDISDHRPVVMKINFNEEVTSSTNDFSSKLDFKIYPNPASKFVAFELPSNQEYTIRIFNTNGVSITSVDNNNLKTLNFNVSNLPKGMYYIQLLTNNKLVSTQKLVLID